MVLCNPGIVNGPMNPGSPQPHFKLNLTKLVKPLTPCNTIEFCSHHGACDAAEVISWICLLNAFVKASMATTSVAPLSDSLGMSEKVGSLFQFLNDANVEMWCKRKRNMVKS